MSEPDFWEYQTRLVHESQVMIDRPHGSSPPRNQKWIYPLDFGYLERTTTVDGCEIDVWIGSKVPQDIDAVAICVDLDKRDVEIKVLPGCTEDETHTVMEFLNCGGMRAKLVKRYA